MPSERERRPAMNATTSTTRPTYGAADQNPNRNRKPRRTWSALTTEPPASPPPRRRLDHSGRRHGVGHHVMHAHPEQPRDRRDAGGERRQREPEPVPPPQHTKHNRAGEHRSDVDQPFTPRVRGGSEQDRCVDERPASGLAEEDHTAERAEHEGEFRRVVAVELQRPVQHLGHRREQEREGNDVEITREAARDRCDPVHERDEEERRLQMQGDIVRRTHERKRGAVDERHERRIGRSREQRPLGDVQVTRFVEQPSLWNPERPAVPFVRGVVPGGEHLCHARDDDERVADGSRQRHGRPGAPRLRVDRPAT